MDYTLGGLLILLIVSSECCSRLCAAQDKPVPQAELDAYPGNPIKRALYRDMKSCVREGKDSKRSVTWIRVPTYIEAVIDTTANKRINFGSSATNIMKARCAEANDAKGHLVGAQFKGPPAWYNLVPQHKSVNANVGQSRGAGAKITDQWVEMEYEAQRWLKCKDARGHSVKWVVHVEYQRDARGYEHPRPTAFKVALTKLGGRSGPLRTEAHFVNALQNTFFVKNAKRVRGRPNTDEDKCEETWFPSSEAPTRRRGG